MLERRNFTIAKIRVPAKRAKTLNALKVETLAEQMLEEGQTTPIRLRADGERYILVEGLHRLEALKALGEDTIHGYLVRANQH